MSKLLTKLREFVQDQEILLVGLIVGLGLLYIPFQHYMPLARYQHYSFSLAAVSTSFLFQAALSWKRLTGWGRATMIGSFLFVGAFAHFFHENPWLGNADLATERQLVDRHRFAIVLLLSSIPLAVCWFRWNREKQGLDPAHPNEARERVTP